MDENCAAVIGSIVSNANYGSVVSDTKDYSKFQLSQFFYVFRAATDVGWSLSHIENVFSSNVIRAVPANGLTIELMIQYPVLAPYESKLNLSNSAGFFTQLPKRKRRNASQSSCFAF